MWRSQLFHHFRRLAFLAVLVCLCSCEANLFGPDSREIGGGYRLKRAGSPAQFALITPHESGGLIIDEIGWREPIIVARPQPGCENRRPAPDLPASSAPAHAPMTVQTAIFGRLAVRSSGAAMARRGFAIRGGQVGQRLGRRDDWS